MDLCGTVRSWSHGPACILYEMLMFQDLAPVLILGHPFQRDRAWRELAGHADGMEILCEQTAESLQAAISSAISDVERAGYRVSKVEMEREFIPV
jgi:hypothetical protein